MNAGAIAALVLEILTTLAPKVYDLIMRGVAGEDISHDELMERLPSELRTKVLDRIKTEQRRAQGLPV